MPAIVSSFTPHLRTLPRMQGPENLASFMSAPPGFMAAAADGKLVHAEPLLEQLMGALLEACSSYTLRCSLCILHACYWRPTCSARLRVESDFTRNKNKFDVACAGGRSAATYLFHLELLHLLIAFCSTQLYTVHATAYEGAHPFTEVLMR